jgi:hypothetical protein
MAKPPSCSAKGMVPSHRLAPRIMRTIGIVRARCKIGMTNLAYNMRRFVCLERMADCDRVKRHAFR